MCPPTPPNMYMYCMRSALDTRLGWLSIAAASVSRFGDAQAVFPVAVSSDGSGVRWLLSTAGPVVGVSVLFLQNQVCCELSVNHFFSPCAKLFSTVACRRNIVCENVCCGCQEVCARKA